jgi:predicted aldo/keto reductase-like oxidoreductase
MYRTETPDANQQKSFLTNVTSTIGNVTNNMTTSVKGVVTMFKNAAKGICENCTHSCPGCPRGINAKQIALNKAQMHAEFK